MLRTLLPPRQSFVMVKGAARLLPAEEPPPAEPPPAEPPIQAPGQQEQHLHLMMQLLRPQDAIRLVGHGFPPPGTWGWDMDREGDGRGQDRERKLTGWDRMGWAEDGDGMG